MYFDIGSLLLLAFNTFIQSILNGAIEFFSLILVNIMSTATNTLNLAFVQTGIKYSQDIAFAILTVKVLFEMYNTYLLQQSGDPDSDPEGIVIRTAQAVIIISTLPWLINQIYNFSMKVMNDVSSLDVGKKDLKGLMDVLKTTMELASPGGTTILALGGIVLLLIIIIMSIQAAIRGAELALMAVIGSFLALNLTSNNRELWNSWLKQVFILCMSQALQLFMIKGSIIIATVGSLDGVSLLTMIGWFWVTLKTPKFLQQFAYSSGFTGTVAGAGKQVGAMYLTRKMLMRA